MIDFLTTPLHYDYMLRAIWISALIGGVCGFLSAFVTLKGWSLMGDALSHAVVPGVALAYLLGMPFALGAFISGILAAGAMGFIKNQTRIREDASIGIVFTTFFAAGVLLITLFPAKVDLKTILFGNLLGIADGDVMQVLIISAVTLLVLGIKWRDLMLFCFDPMQARALGLPVVRLHYLLLALLAATSVAALQTVGACLVVAMLVTPGVTAYLLTERFGVMVIVSALMGLATSIVGAYLSYFFNGSTGGCIVTLQTLIFIAVFLWAPKHGILAERQRLKNLTKNNAPIV
ncbi:MAG: metal ABC transporter permease [Verrucomicrobia bacterium]|nr:MAG: metal ABC transporter permease [Verrucomicrobiota bacterium]